MCHRAPFLAGVVLGPLLASGLLLGTLAAILHHIEKKERRRAEAGRRQSVSSDTAGPSTVSKTVIVENRGSIGGTSGVAEVVTTGPHGTLVTTVPTAASGVAVVSTQAAGVPGTVSVEPGRKAIITAEHPVGQPEQAVVTSTTRQ